MKPLGLRSILIATDLSPETNLSFESARQLADLTGASMHAVHSTEDIKDADALEEHMNALGNGNRVDARVLRGPPVAIITQEASRTEADVIVIGRHRGKSRGLGGTADRVVRTARVPCLILPERLVLPLRSVLVPVDITEAARGTLAVALTWASALRRPRGADTPTRLDVLHVRTDKENGDVNELEMRLHEQVTEIQNRLAGIAGVLIEQAVERSADVASTVLQRAAEKGADLIVLGTRAERMDTDPLGSVSSEIVKRATKPVLLVPPEVWRPDAAEIPA